MQKSKMAAIRTYRIITTALVADGGLVLYISRSKLFRNQLIGGHLTIFGW